MKALRDGAADRPARDDAIFKNLFSLPYFTEGESFFLYNAFGSEAATARIVRELLARGRQVYLPRVEGRDMLPVRYVGQPLSVGRYGIAEPQGEAFGGFPQVCLLPMLAADRACRRLGYGGGYYDRWLARAEAAGADVRKVGICYAFQVTERLPAEPHDISPDVIVTDEEILYRGGQGVHTPEGAADAGRKGADGQ